MYYLKRGAHDAHSLLLLPAHPSCVLGVLLPEMHHLVDESLHDVHSRFCELLMLVAPSRMGHEYRLEVDDVLEALILYCHLCEIPLSPEQQIGIVQLCGAHG